MSPLYLLHACVAVLLAAAPPKYVIETGTPRTFTGVYRGELRTTNFKVVEWEVYAALAPELPSQKNVKTTLDPGGQPATELSDRKLPILHAKLPVTKGEAREQLLPVSVKYEGQLIPRKLVPLRPGVKPPVVPPLEEDERKHYLAATKLLDFEAEAFQKWLARHSLRRGKTEVDVDFGRRVFVAMTRQYSYELIGEMPSVSELCLKTKADCDGLSSVDVAAMRANGIPARMLFGMKMKSLKPGEKFIGHGRAEFFAEGVGWVPVDLACAETGSQKAPLTQFGFDRGDLLTLHIGYEVILPFPNGPAPRMNLGKPTYYSRGRGTPDTKNESLSWEVTIAP